MRSRLLLSLTITALCPLGAQVKFSGADPVAVEIDGKPFAEFHQGADVRKPFLFPIRTASGKIITRHYPMEKIEGESRDHPHHRGLWFTYDDVNGVKFWESDPALGKQNMGTIAVHDVKTKPGKSGTLSFVGDWTAPDGKVQLVEHRTMTFRGSANVRIIDFDITLTAPDKVVFGDTKEGAFAIRLADSMIEKKGGRMVNAEGKSGMKDVWGHKSKWVDYTGDVDGEKVGVAMIDHPSNPRYPTYWHARDYGLFALNPFGQKAFDATQEESHWTLDKGQSIRFRWRVAVHPGDMDSAAIEKMYSEFAK